MPELSAMVWADWTAGLLQFLWYSRRLASSEATGAGQIDFSGFFSRHGQKKASKDSKRVKAKSE
jgi:hypothetical protein